MRARRRELTEVESNRLPSDLTGFPAMGLNKLTTAAENTAGNLLSVGGRGNFPAFSSGPCNWLCQPVGWRVQAQEANDRTVRRRTRARPSLRIQRQRPLTRPGHRLA